MSNLNKIDVPVAVQNHSKLDLSCDHVTSMDFLQTQPVNYRHMIKTEHLVMSVDSKVRPAPIEVPFYGMLRQNVRAFFVPYRLVFPNWDSFYNDTIASNVSQSSLVSEPPTINNTELVLLFTTYGLSEVTTGSVYDFTYNGSNYVYTYSGRYILKLLRSLGYEPIYAKTDVFVYNALALLAYVKIYVDWYANSQYLNSSDVLLFEKLIKYNDPTNHLQLTAANLFSLLSLIGNVVYDTDDYYVNAWDNPVSPNSGQFTAFGFNDPTSVGGAYVSTNTIGSPEMFTNSGSVGTTYIHEALKKLTDFQKRHALAGARNIDRVLAQYGIITDSLRQQRSIYVGNLSVPVDVGSVYATAAGRYSAPPNSFQSSVGDYAGAGYGSASKSFDFTADEEGIFLVIASIIPSGHMVQGYDRNNRHISKSDFFVPEYDSLGVQSIERGEVYISPSYSFTDTAAAYAQTFGYSGRYGEYKRPKSFLTGDMTLPSTMLGGNSWHLFRMFDDSSWPEGIEDVGHSLDFTRGSDYGRYHRVFQITNGIVNPFYCFFHFNTAVYSPCKPLFETYEFDSLSKSVPTENGNKVN